jgi:hypothetical protein
MVGALALVLCLAYAEEAREHQHTPLGWWCGAGAASAWLFLGEYSAGVAVILTVAWVAWSERGRRRWLGLGAVVLGAALLAGPWLIYQTRATGNPWGLAGQALALKTGDATAEPETVRATWSAAAPILHLDKLGNKGLTALQLAFGRDVWAGGALFFAAFFVTGLLYRFRYESLHRLRGWTLLLLVALAVAHAFLDSGESERSPFAYGAPLLIVFGTGFASVLIASSPGLAAHPRWVAAGLLAVQALPLAKDVVEPRRLHFGFPPYYPGLFVSLRAELDRRGMVPWMCDVPAGAAWYSGRRVWAQPARLRDFFAIGAEQPIRACVLTPHTLDRAAFSELLRPEPDAGRLGSWSEVYRALALERVPPSFPLSFVQKISDNLYVLLDPALTVPPR